MPRTTTQDPKIGLRNRLSELVLPEPSRVASELQRIVLERLDQTKTG
jgi:hypothetical protein